MNFNVEDNFVVLGKIIIEDGEDQPAVKIQIQFEKLFAERDLFAYGLIGCSSGIKQEFVSHNCAVNENSSYYLHETISTFSSDGLIYLPIFQI